MADTRPQPSAEPVADWLQECTDGRVSSHTITMLNAFRRWYDEYRVNPALEAARREALEEAAKVCDEYEQDRNVRAYEQRQAGRDDSFNCANAAAASRLATAIRALKENTNG